MTIPAGLYTIAMQVASAALPLLERGEGKLARGIRGRREVVERMEAWAARERDPSRPLVWFHAASVGEGLQAIAVIRELQSRRPDVQVVHTYFSPSAESLARRSPADFFDYLPLDLPSAVGAALDALKPSVIAFSKSDVWPNLVESARRRGVRLALLSATLPEASSRLRWPARALLRPSYARLDAVAAISQADASRFEGLGVSGTRRSVMGDARFDQVWERASRVERGSALLSPLMDDRPTLVAGSTWPPDEERLIGAWSRARTPLTRLVLVPHEPTAAHLEETETLLAAAGLTSSRLSSYSPGADVLLVDRVGVLGDLYALAAVAYVGGGWGTAGIHSVLEPAAFGVPVLFGPRHANAREAAELVRAGGAFAAESAEELEARIGTLMADQESRRRAGESARRYVLEGIGAATRGAAVVEALLDR